jgi:hypothetical protein
MSTKTTDLVTKVFEGALNYSGWLSLQKIEDLESTINNNGIPTTIGIIIQMWLNKFKPENKYFIIDVGGTLLLAKQTSITYSTVLEIMFSSGRHSIIKTKEGYPFTDRDPEIFGCILIYLQFYEENLTKKYPIDLEMKFYDEMIFKNISIVERELFFDMIDELIIPLTETLQFYKNMHVKDHLYWI